MVSKGVAVGRMMIEAETKSIPEMWAVRQSQRLPERIAKTALAASFKSPHVRAPVKQLASAVNFPGCEEIGSGVHQTVYRKGSNVIKLLFDTLLDGKSPPADTAELLQRNEDRCRATMGDAWTPTEYDIVRLPFFDREAVIARQPFVRANRQYSSVADLILDTGVRPRDKQELGDRINDTYAETGLMVDIIGPGNVVQSSERLRIVDTIVLDEHRLAESYDATRTYGILAQGEIALLRSSGI
jgi:hypothetical protein